MVAASRRPRLRPCAPIGGITWPASPISAMRRVANRRAISMPSGNAPCPGSTATLPRIECERRSISASSASALERLDPRGLLGRDHADEARAQAGQRHQSERAMRGMELGRDVVVRPRVGEVEGQRGLRIAAAVGLDAGGRAAERAPAVRRRRRGAPSRCRRRRAKCGRRRRRSRPHGPPGRSARGRRARRRAPASPSTRCRFSMFQANASRPISAASKRTSGARHSRSVSSTIRIVRNAPACARQRAPDVERLERRDRAGEQGRGAVVDAARRPGDQRGRNAGRRERDRGRQAGRAAADDGDLRLVSAMRLGHALGSGLGCAMRCLSARPPEGITSGPR